jgi:hypothetical protein
MKRLLLCASVIVGLTSITFAGPAYSGKEMQQYAAPAPCPQWYADYEWNVDLWGTYVFTDTEWMNDKYLETDHAWGGGIDFKYFFMRYFGIGFEGWVVDANQARVHDFIDLSEGTNLRTVTRENNAIGSVLGTLTLRYPIPCTRFSPYVFGGGGAIFGGGQRPHNVSEVNPAEPDEGFELIVTRGFTNARTEAIGQFGGGLEFRITPHIGWMADFSWNVIDGPNDNFGMVRSGLTFAF